MHYVVPIAVLASLATIGLAAPQNDAGDNSRCGISLFIGDGSPPCNVNTSNKSGGHGQSGDLKIDGECVPQAGSSFGATDPTFGSMSIQVNTVEGHSCNSDNNGGYCYPVLNYSGRSYNMVTDSACTNGGRHPSAGTQGWWWRCQVTCPPGA